MAKAELSLAHPFRSQLCEMILKTRDYGMSALCITVDDLCSSIYDYFAPRLETMTRLTRRSGHSSPADDNPLFKICSLVLFPAPPRH